MATKKDLDNILNNMKSKKSSGKKQSLTTAKSRSKSDVDNMSVDDDVLNSLGNRKSAGIKSDAPKKLAPLPPKKSDTEKKSAPSENKSKKRIVITGELPDYDSLREKELAKDRQEKERLEAEKKAKEKKRLEAEQKAREEAERKRLEAEETKRRLLEEAEEFTVEEIAEISTSEEYDDDYDDYEDFNVFDESNNDSDPVGSLIDNIREDAEKAFADIENSENDDDSEEYDDYDDEYEEDFDDEYDDDSKETSLGFSATLENILDEDPDEIINERSEKTEPDKTKKPKLKLKKNIYTFLGLIFAVLACVGLVTVISKSISLLGGFSSGNSKKNGFEPVVYPVVIMDIESFETPAELPSDQIITAAIWSMIMSEDAISDYEMTFDVVKIPAVDVESYAVKLFGENLPELNHTTVGPAEARFYYNEETKSYNVPIAPVTYTYSPEIKGATKNDNTYTIVVNYIDELPEWLPKVSSKAVEFKLTETNDGYTIDSMKVLSTSNNSL